MADTIVNGYYNNGNCQHFQFGDVEIYGSQYNIGREIVKKAQATSILNLADAQQTDGKRKFREINMLFLGPPHTMLRDQTRADLEVFLKERLKFPLALVDHLVRSHVLNSSSIGDDYENIKFIKTLRSDPHHILHLLVIDEAHYGIAHASVMDRFQQHLAKVREEITRAVRSPPTLLILKVSATIDVLSRVIQSYKDGTMRVEWSKLRSEDPKRFDAPDYRDISGLRLYNDTNPAVLTETKLANRSDIVVKEYTDTLARCLMTVFNRAATVDWRSCATWQALQFLLPGSTNAKIAARASAVDYPSSENYIVVVRMELNAHIDDLHRNIVQLFEQMSPNSMSALCPFEIIKLNQESDSIRAQLSSKAIRRLSRLGKTPEMIKAVKHLADLPCLILLNEKLGMGERLPPTCMAYDVRARYRGDASSMEGNASTFIQDIGRCCGHKKPQAVVLMSVTDKKNRASGEQGQLTTKNITFPHLHGLLTAKNLPTAEHPEKHERVHSKLLPCSVILDAEPQMGKTGAILSVLEILHFEHVLRSALPFPAESLSTPKKLTIELCRIANAPNETAEDNIDRLRKTLDTDDLFRKYHAMIDHFPEAKQLLDSIYKNSLLGPMSTTRRAEERVFSVLDCGCGLHGIVHTFRNYQADLEIPVHVVGIDLHESISELQRLKPVAKVTFTASVSDMATTTDVVRNHSPFNVALYCLSFFENDVTRHLHWAHGQLKTGGLMIIADSSRRFPDKFEKSVEKLGFKHYTSYSIADMFKVFSFRKTADDVDGSVTVQLKPY